MRAIPFGSVLSHITRLQTHRLLWESCSLLSGNTGFGWEDWFLLRVQRDSLAPTRTCSTSVTLSFLPKCWHTFWVGFGWGVCDKAFDIDSNHLPLPLLLPGWICSLVHCQEWPLLSCWCPAHNDPKYSPFNFTGLARPLAFLLRVRVSPVPLAVLEGVNAALLTSSCSWKRVKCKHFWKASTLCR